MKTLIVFLAIIGICPNLIFSQISDSTISKKNKLNKNLYGISLDNINMNNILNFNPKNISIIYKRNYNAFSIRLGIFTKNDYSKNILYSNTNVDSIYSEPNIEYHIYNNYKRTGASLGIEKNIYDDSNISFYYGFDLSYTNLNYFSKSESINIDKSRKNTSIESYILTNKKPSDVSLSGNSKCFKPFLGFTNNITEHFAVAFELNLLFNRVKYTYYPSTMNTDLSGKIIICCRI